MAENMEKENYDYIEIKDITGIDPVLLQQVDGDLSPMENMDSWIDNGIKLKKQQYNTSKLYVLAKLPANSTANISHTLEIIAYNNNGQELYTSYLNLEAEV